MSEKREQPPDSLETLHKSRPQAIVDHSTDTERWDDAAHARHAALQPVDPDLAQAIAERRASITIVQVQAEEMEGRADELHGRGSKELGRGRPADVFLCGLREWKRWSQDGWEVEGGEDSQTVSGGEQGVGDGRHGAGGHGPVHFRELAVLEQTQAQVGGAGGEELGRPARGGGRRPVFGHGFESIERVRREVGAAVQYEDQREGLREQEVVRSKYEGAQ